nr:unnamed protein product [Callosobruchus analis]
MFTGCIQRRPWKSSNNFWFLFFQKSLYKN